MWPYTGRSFVGNSTTSSYSGHSSFFFAWLVINLQLQRRGEKRMLYYALVFLLSAVLAAVLGFGGIAVAFAGIAKLLFVLFLILFLVSFVMHLGRRA